MAIDKVRTMRFDLPKILAMLCIMVFIQGCSNKIVYRYDDLGVTKKWDKDSEVKKNIVGIKDVKHTVKDGSLRFYLKTDYLRREWAFDSTRVHEDINVAGEPMAFFPLFGQIICLMDLKACFGYWIYDDNVYVEHKNKRLSGNTKTISTNSDGDRVSVKASLNAFNDSDELIVESIKLKGTGRDYKGIELRDELNKLPQRPEKVDIEFTFIRGKHQFSSSYKLTQNQLNQLNLQSDLWLSEYELKTKYIKQLKAALAEGDYKSASDTFAIIEKLPFEKPDSFWYRYAVTLKEDGQLAKSKEIAQKYLNIAKNRRYEDQAKKILEL